MNAGCSLVSGHIAVDRKLMAAPAHIRPLEILAAETVK